VRRGSLKARLRNARGQIDRRLLMDGWLVLAKKSIWASDFTGCESMPRTGASALKKTIYNAKHERITRKQNRETLKTDSNREKFQGMGSRTLPSARRRRRRPTSATTSSAAPVRSIDAIVVSERQTDRQRQEINEREGTYRNHDHQRSKRRRTASE
jgi:hypothetical protein